MEAKMRWMQSLLRRRDGDVHAVYDGQLAVPSLLGWGSGEWKFSETDDEIDGDCAACC